MKQFRKYLQIIQESNENFNSKTYLENNISEIKTALSRNEIQIFERENFKEQIEKMKKFFTVETNWEKVSPSLYQIIFIIYFEDNKDNKDNIKIFEVKSKKIPSGDMWEYENWDVLHVKTINSSNFKENFKKINFFKIEPRDGGSRNEGWSFKQLLVEMSSKY